MIDAWSTWILRLGLRVVRHSSCPLSKVTMNESSIRQETGAFVSFSALCHAPCAMFIGSDHGGNVSVKVTALLESSRDFEPMQVDRLKLLNFKGFATLDQGLNRQFTLITGNNGVGKSNLLDALSIAFGAFLLGIPTVEQRHISQREVREFEQDFDGTAEFNRSIRWWWSPRAGSSIPCQARSRISAGSGNCVARRGVVRREMHVNCRHSLKRHPGQSRMDIVPRCLSFLVVEPVACGLSPEKSGDGSARRGSMPIATATNLACLRRTCWIGCAAKG